MAQQLAYVIITPYSLHKSRTGGILSRLITRTGLDLVGARMFAPSPGLVKRYSEKTISANDPQDRRIQELIYRYILQNFSPDPKSGRRILTVGDHQVDLPLCDDVRQPIANDLPPRRADDVSYKKYAHGLFHTAKHKNGADRWAVES